VKESAVEKHLVESVERHGGFQRKLRWVGRPHAPDRFVAFPVTFPGVGVWLVELKRPGKDAEPGQGREHARLRAAGVRVIVIDTIEGVDEFIEAVKA